MLLLEYRQLIEAKISLLVVAQILKFDFWYQEGFWRMSFRHVKICFINYVLICYVMLTSWCFWQKLLAFRDGISSKSDTFVGVQYACFGYETFHTSHASIHLRIKTSVSTMWLLNIWIIFIIHEAEKSNYIPCQQWFRQLSCLHGLSWKLLLPRREQDIFQRILF